ncbi:ComF family protein [Humidesulfovibrio sp.]
MRNSAARLGLPGLAGFAVRALRAALLAEVRCAGCGCIVPGAASGALCLQCVEAVVPLLCTACPGCGEMPGEKIGGMSDGNVGEAPDEAVGDISGQAPKGAASEKSGEAVGESGCEAKAALCPRCQASPRPWSRVLVYGEYQGRLKDMILGYKFSARLDFGRRLQECALAAFEAGLAAGPELSGCEGLVPVPLHPRRLLARGFNQSRELARLISARHGLPIWQDALVRVRRTTPQMRLARGARAENIRGAFAGRAELVAGRQLLLVDDIMTTGATLEECARALLHAGAKRVDVLALARA